MKDDTDMTSTEELVEAALLRQADRVPDPGPVRAALDWPAPARIRHLLVAAAGVCVVVAAVVVPIALSQAPETPPANPGGSITAPSTTGQASAGIPMRYTLTAPAGLVRYSRAADTTRSEYRQAWGSRQPVSAVTLRVIGPGHPDWDRARTTGTPTDVNGTPARLTGGGGSIAVSWQPDPDTLLTLTYMTTSGVNTIAVAEQVAGSVRPDGTTLEPVVGFGWLPEGLNPGYAATAVVPDDNYAVHSVAKADSSEQDFTATATLTPAGSPVPENAAVRHLPDGRKVSVTVTRAAWSPEQRLQAAQHIADTVTVDAGADTSWAGN